MISWPLIISALWLGILTSITPCTLATNIAAISFIGRQVASARRLLLAGLLYTAGTLLGYGGLGVLVMDRLLASEVVSRFLQTYMNQALGPILIVTGMLLLGLIGGGAAITLAGPSLRERVSRGGVGWAFVLAVIFAVSFCPVSAGLFFGGLLSLAAKANSRLLLPAIYGLGTALPVLAFALLLALGSRWVGRAFAHLQRIERAARLATAVVLVVVGIYCCLTGIYGLSLTGL